MEERVSQSIASRVTNKIMEALHVSQDTYMLTPDAWTHLKGLDRHVVMSFVENEKHKSLFRMLNKKTTKLYVGGFSDRFMKLQPALSD